MAWYQTRDFNKSNAGKRKGWCLQNVRKGYGIGAKYPNAWEAWQKSPKHTNTPPTGVDVPVYFWWKNASNGHIGVRLANGKFWSDGDIYSSIAAYERSHAPDYVGWSELVNGVRVIKKDNLVDRLRATISSLKDKLSSRETNEALLKKKIDAQVKTIKQQQADFNAKQEELNAELERNSNLVIENRNLEDQVAMNDRVIKNQAKEIDRLEAELAACGQGEKRITGKQAVRVLIELFKGWLNK